MESPEITADKILELEFNYIKDTANQAVDDRYKLLNFYIAVATFVATIAIGAFTLGNVQQYLNLQTSLSALCFLISMIGWVFLAMMIRLRQAWYESIQALNQIKSYYATHAGPTDLADAFVWNIRTIPYRHRMWNIHFYSALLIIIINDAFLAAGILILNLDPLLAAGLVAFSFAAQLVTYRISLYRNL